MISAPIFPVKQINVALKPGVPCLHLGCLQHVSHPCEGGGRIAGGLPELTQKPVLVVNPNNLDMGILYRLVCDVITDDLYKDEFMRRCLLIGSWCDALDLISLYVTIQFDKERLGT